MKGLTLRHLRYFTALAQQGHFGRAAEVCAISQPALSVQMKELEEIAGAPLIERGARQIRLTNLGVAFAERAAGILRSVDDLDGFVRAAQAPFSGVLRIGVIPTIAPYLLPALIRHMGQAYPNLDLRPREAITQTLIRDLGEGRLDLAIVALPVSESGLHEEPLFEEEFVLVRPCAEANAPVPSAEGLLEMRLLLLEEGHCFRDQALAFCTPARVGSREFMEGSSLTTLVQMVGAGIGVTLIPEMAVATETRLADVAVARLPAPRPKRMIGLVWRNSSPMAGQYRQIAEVLRGFGPSAGR
ncbi:LysR substrate-binding domain-containing protein [Thioclava sp. A2]|uniref:hydrogen peroxide-inducible genes activator n=1 Tax=Thioclava sp. FCG-A2 TaxID=3080562 RepID=UPI002955D90F|nr:LysR substrate-binding domain-containing protein [Thioclava sp. A2]MDV7272328.1 LysR substrate-binding domain-containing protein [Thioclava sp. A2]